MKHVLAVCLSLIVSGSAFGLDQNLEPVPATDDAVELFKCVKYKDHDEIAPCAVPKIIQVLDPCACEDPCNCCERKCVSIKICVPPPCECKCACECEGEQVKVSKNGTRVRYDYGEYAVDVRVKEGYIEVDYQD